VLSHLQLVDTGEPDEWQQSPVFGASLPDGRYLLCFKDAFDPAVEVSRMKRLSDGCEALDCQVLEGVMVNCAFMYVNSTRVWEVLHDADEGVDHLVVDGTPPAALQQIHAGLQAAQDEQKQDDGDWGIDHLFEVPIALADAICGYRYNRRSLASGKQTRFTRLAPASS
jgi:hypothetical protein